MIYSAENQQCQTIVSEALQYGRQFVRYGKPASYIEVLAKKDPSRLGVAICDLKGQIFALGDSEYPFSMQSIAKVISLILVIEQNGFEYIFTKVGLEPTGDAFNSLVRLENLATKKPFNPMINAGAIAIASCIRGDTVEQRQQTFLAFARKLTGNETLEFDYEVYRSERETGYKNRSIANLMKSNGILDGEIEPHLEVYFSLCSVNATCRDLAYFAAVLSNDGRDPKTGEELVPLRVVRLVRSLMVTCGMYDFSGEYAATVGMPSKSGVGGGIIACPIGKCGIAVYGPALDGKGNSVGGLKILEYLSQKLELSMF